jgi:hypothetical protein
MNQLKRVWRWLDRPVDARWHWVVLAIMGIVLALGVWRGWW